MQWQKRARVGVAVFGIAVAIAVYATIGERQSAEPLSRTPGLDPSAILESVGASFQRSREARQDFVIEADRQLTYEDGVTKFVGVTIMVLQRAGRDLIVSAREAQAGEGQEELEITGDVQLTASDGFVATADQATLREVDATVRMGGAVSFQKDRITGSSVGMAYDHIADVLALLEQARVTVADETGAVAAEFNSDAATLASMENYLTLEGNVHVQRGEQVLEADRSTAYLSEAGDFTRIELRGNASVVGGGAFESMMAGEIDLDLTRIELRGNARVVGGGAFDLVTAGEIELDFTDDGTTLERVVLANNGAIVMSSDNGESGREFAGDVLDLLFAADASLTQAAGRGNVRVRLPGVEGLPARSIMAQTFEATGEPGKDLTSARFDDQVEYREEATGGRAERAARSSTLRITLADAAVTAAVFSGGVQFEEQGLQASGAQARYDPISGTLQLSGTDAGGAPRVSDAQIEIEADTIGVTLEGRRMTASGSVRTLLRSGTTGRLPGLLRQSEAANISADALDYQGGAGAAVYSGNATLWQGETAIRADVITLDQTRADLVASGAARSNIVFDTEGAIGRADEIRYDDGSRTITYRSQAPNPTLASPVTPVQLSGPQGDLRARRIDVILGETTSRAERLEAYTEVNMLLGTRVATGDRLTYFAEDERYVMSGIATVPVTIVEECRETSGRTMTFFKSAERIIVDGSEEVRTQSRRGESCVAAPAL